ncbi:hypothetical protein F4818DRAFT_446000 [Hypoxylon cercidicola]|nr:hypothetical protein F4818DRAFT_446000 [Hypoxylon cercidicola]
MARSPPPEPKRGSPARRVAERLGLRSTKPDENVAPKHKSARKRTSAPRNTGFSAAETFNNPMSPFYVKRDEFSSPRSRTTAAHSPLAAKNRADFTSLRHGRPPRSDLRAAIIERRRRHSQHSDEDDHEEVTNQADVNSPPDPAQLFDIMDLTSEETIRSLQIEGIMKGLKVDQVTHKLCRKALRKTGDFDKALDLLVNGPDSEMADVQAKKRVRVRKRVRFSQVDTWYHYV